MPRGIYKRPSVEERLQKYIVIDPKTGCHIWIGVKDKDGYGRIKIYGKMVRVHRLAYELHTGQKIPEGMHVLHEHCDNPTCCNPVHLKIGTNQDNMTDRNRKGRQARGENQGLSKLIDEQVIEIRDSPKTLRQLAKEYGVVDSLIGQIKRREIWRHL